MGSKTKWVTIAFNPQEPQVNYAAPQQLIVAGGTVVHQLHQRSGLQVFSNVGSSRDPERIPPSPPIFQIQ